MSADFLDDASDNEQAERDRLIDAARKQINKKKPTGRCYYCNDVLDDPTRVYCSPECRDDHELEQEAMRRHRGRY